MVREGDDVAKLICAALDREQLDLFAGDVVVVASKILAKAEGRSVDLESVQPSDAARTLAQDADKDPRLVQLVLDESTHVSRVRAGVLLVRHRLGFVSANAGIDRSNIENTSQVLLLPTDPDAWARELRSKISSTYGVDLGVVVADTHGRAFRRGNLGVAIGVSGFEPLADLRGTQDLFGNVLEATIVPVADQLAAAAGLVTGESAEGLPVVVVRGALVMPGEAGATSLVWSPEEDLYA
jgi:coenzyme F420-0:L-glutamate ligase / coenzyme F420-1:gamma-L-glutamate ligase